ncbi:MAG: polyphenol oxidase family protein, partial [Terriglobia bacterium]
MKRQRQASDKGGGLLRAERLARYPWLLHAFTTRWSGNLSYGVDAGGAGVGRNRSRLLKTLVKPQPAPAGRGRFRLVTLRQRHSDIVRVVDSQLRDVRREPDGALKLVGDALITDQVGLLLAVQVADCLPILLVDPVRRVVANVHAGWRGTLARIVEKTVGQMQLRFGSQPRQLVAAIGPGIHRCCYAVGREVYERYVAQFAEGEALFRCREPSPSEVHWNPKVTGRPLKPTADHRRDAGATSGSSPA